MSTNESPISRFMRKVGFPDPKTGCWNWKAAKDFEGYGFFKLNKKQMRAHRAVLILHGQAVPDDRVVCHKCDNPSCVNPNHLFVGTLSDNVRDCVKKKRQKEIRKTHCPQGHPFAGENLYIVAKTGKRQCRRCRCVAMVKGNRKKQDAKRI